MYRLGYLRTLLFGFISDEKLGNDQSDGRTVR